MPQAIRHTRRHIASGPGVNVRSPPSGVVAGVAIQSVVLKNGAGASAVGPLAADPPRPPPRRGGYGGARSADRGRLLRPADLRHSGCRASTVARRSSLDRPIFDQRTSQEVARCAIALVRPSPPPPPSRDLPASLGRLPRPRGRRRRRQKRRRRQRPRRRSPRRTPRRRRRPEVAEAAEAAAVEAQRGPVPDCEAEAEIEAGGGAGEAEVAL